MNIRSMRSVFLAGLTLALLSCITVNIYFPEAEVKKAAEDIVNDVRGTDKQKKEEIKKEVVAESAGFSLVPGLYAQQATEDRPRAGILVCVGISLDGDGAVGAEDHAPVTGDALIVIGDDLVFLGVVGEDAEAALHRAALAPRAEVAVDFDPEFGRRLVFHHTVTSLYNSAMTGSPPRGFQTLLGWSQTACIADSSLAM